MPNDPAFQKRVIRAALGLLEEEHGPLIVDYPEDVPAASADTATNGLEGMVCPIDFPALPDRDAPTGELGIALRKEIDALAPWHELAVRMRKRTTVGPSELTMRQAGNYLAAFLDDQNAPCPRADLAPAHVLKLAYEDLKAYYSEAITLQNGFNTSKRVEDWLFNETVLGAALWRLRAICRASSDEYHQFLGRNSIVPDRQINPPNGPGARRVTQTLTS